MKKSSVKNHIKHKNINHIKHSGNYSAIVENNPHKMAIFVKTFERNSAKKLWFFEGTLKIPTLLQT